MPKTNFVCELTAEQAAQLAAILTEQNWEMDAIPYARWRARKEKTSAVAYESGKFVVQGKGTADLIQFIVEPEILHEARMGYEMEIARLENPQMFGSHVGIDESGKGDYFGPLVIAAVHVDEESSTLLFDQGIRDSKTIKSDRKIRTLAQGVKDTVHGNFAIVRIGPERYNQLYDKFANLNYMLAWGHARALEDVLEKVPDCPWALSDQFGKRSTVSKALMNLGRRIKLEQRPKAESDIAVAAASIIARAEFVSALEALAKPHDLRLPKGASDPQVAVTAADIYCRGGMEALGKVAKLHFRTTEGVTKLVDSGGDAGGVNG